jgi:choline dehydrogenase
MHDIVIVGAGSAGSAIAARASENPALSVLLLEAGPDYSDLAATPYDLVNGHDNSYTDHDWGLAYAPTQGRQIRFPRGRVTGGSSAVNTAIALRGMPEDYDEWASFGNDAWAWEKVLPAFKRLERDLDFGEADWHGDAGPITIRRYPRPELAAPQAAFLEAADRLGYPACADANEPWGWGAGPHPMNKLGRLRVSCAIGYLAPARVRPNLEIRPHAFVTRLMIENGRARGVEVQRQDGEIERVEGRLIVLAAGSILSPAILTRSGVGPRAALEALGVPVLSDMPGVGQNLSDHPALSVVCLAKDAAVVDPDQPIIQTILRYTAEGSPKRNDLQIEMITFSKRRDGAPAFAVAGVVEYQYGRGELKLASADPHEAPIIENRFCEDERDLARLVGCMKDVLAFARTGPIADLSCGFAFPRGGEVTDEELAGLCRRLAGSGYHPSGTAKMGPASDPMAVVGQYGQCHGLDGLVIADASIMPFVPRANTNLTAIMIGEKIGEQLRTRPAMYGL